MTTNPSLAASVTSMAPTTNAAPPCPEGTQSPDGAESRYVHPTSQKLFQKCNTLRYVPIFGEAVECYGPKFVGALDTVTFLNHGMADKLLRTALNPMFKKRYMADTLEYQRYSIVSNMGWSIKPFTALVSDAFAFFGYKKRWFLTVSALLGFACSIVFAMLPSQHSSAVVAAVMAFLMGFGQASIDILSEGLYARKMRAQPSGGPSLVSSVWFVQMIAGIIASVTSGTLADRGQAWVVVILCGVCMGLCLPFCAFNWMEEEKNRVERLEDARKLGLVGETDSDGSASLEEASGKPSSVRGLNEPQRSDRDSVEEEMVLDIPTYCGGVLEFNKEVLVRNWRITVFSLLMTVIVVATAVVTALYSGPALYTMAFGGAVVLIGLLFWSMPFVVAKAGLYALLTYALYVTFASPMEGFLLENDACDSSYPQFSYTFYNTISGVIGNIAGAVGVVAFAHFFSKRSYRLTFMLTTFLFILASIFDLIIVKRWNLPAIPDHYFYIFGDAVIYQMAYMLNWMPMCVILAQLCPEGSESMVFALLAAMSNHGDTIGKVIGSLLIEYVWPVSTETCDFDNLWKMIVLGHCALPALLIPLVFPLLPASRICDMLDYEEKTTPATRSASEPSDDSSEPIP